MGSTKTNYPRELRETPPGKHIYTVWVRIKSSGRYAAEFTDFIDFYNWSMENGYAEDTRLCRLNDTLPYSPENCEWRRAATNRDPDSKEIESIIAWNRAVNRIRVHYGMKPFPLYSGEEFGDRTESGLISED